ncbi:MAG: hypothetical protein NC123_02845 [Butyrivibrio sp.]|nr:hypothetical protein [Acetatifactor muris]MCM1558478.1 hypothetical protein [Butyrivibrio sp.]
MIESQKQNKIETIMRTLFSDKKKYLLPAIHFLLSFLYERCIFRFDSGRDIVLPIPRNNIISDTAERVLAYAISKLFAAVLIFFLWYLLFWIVENWKKKRNIRFFTVLFAVSLVIALLIWPLTFYASVDNYITYSFARRFWPEYWHGAYTGFLYAALLMVVPNPVFIAVFQLLFGFFVLGYLYNRIVDSPVLRGKGKYCVFLVFLIPRTYALFTDPYRTEPYALLCMFAVSMTAMDVVDRRKRGKFSLVCNILLCGFISVWRTEGIILGFLLFLVQLLFVYRYKPRKAFVSFLCLLLAFGAFLLPQKLGDIKYYGKDYYFINSFNTLKNIFNHPDADLFYEKAQDDYEALEAVVPVELIRNYGMDGYRRYNYANGRNDINQSLADDATASAYMRAYYRIVAHNLKIYAKTQISILLTAITVIPSRLNIPSTEPPVHDLPSWTLQSWSIGEQDYFSTLSFMTPLVNLESRQRFSASAWEAIGSFEDILQEIHFYSTVLILIPLFDIFLFFREGIRFLKRKKNLFGLAGIAFLLLGQAAAIVLVMPATMIVYLHAYYYCSLILCLIYANYLRCRKIQEI